MAESTVTAPFGDIHDIQIPQHPINCSDMNYFDELENECWNLIQKYCDKLGIKLLPHCESDESSVSYNIAKGLQDYILESFQEAGVQLKFENEQETMSMTGL